MLKKIVVLFSIYFFVSNEAICEEYFKYEPCYSFLIKGGISHLIDPINKQVYIELKNSKKNNIKDKDQEFEYDMLGMYSNLYVFCPNVCILFEYRFFNNIFGFGGLLGYSNRKFGIFNALTLSKFIYNNYHLDYGFNLVLYPKGVGGVCFYVGMKFYTKLNANTINLNIYDKKVDSITIDSEMCILKKISRVSNNNYGVFGGLKLEVDRTGFLFGFEIEEFLNSMNQYDKNFDEYRLIPLSLSIFIGFDFARLYSGYFI